MKIIIDDDHIAIHEDGGDEVVYWDRQEWLDDPQIVTSIASAIDFAHTNPEQLRDLLSNA